MRAPIILVGENVPAEPAIRDRSLLVVFNESDRTNEQTQNYLFLKKNKDLINQLGRALLETSLELSDDELVELNNEAQSTVDNPNLVSPEFSPRIKRTLSNALLGMELLNVVVARLGFDFEDVFCSCREVVDALVKSVEEYLLDGQDKNIGVIDQSFAVFDRMGLEYGKDYQVINGGTEIAFRFQEFYDRFKKYVKTNDIDIETHDLEQFKILLRQKPYFIKANRVVRFKCNTKEPHKAHILNCQKLFASVELENISEACNDTSYKHPKAS
jgi:hypothetical protein